MFRPESATALSLPAGVALQASVSPAQAGILTFEALALVADLERAFRGRRRELLDRRRQRQQQFDAGERPDFLPETAEVRAGDWRIGTIPADLLDRRVEITGPVDRKRIVNALNSGASVFMADFEDASSPTWANVVDGQVHLRDAVRRAIDFVHPDTGKVYALSSDPATLVARPRGWHLDEKHVLVDGEPVSASLFDFALYAFHNAAELIARGSGPYFYLPKLESHLEARLWNDAFVATQRALELPEGTIKATVLIETLPAAFEMDEILWELRDHVVGLNCGRWDYIFSFVKTFRASADHLLPDRASVGMDRRFLSAYSLLLVRTCHRRGAFAMGGMAAQIPVKDDPDANAAALDKVRTDKRREAENGHDGTWVAHPALVAVAREEFDRVLTGPNQLERPDDGAEITAEDLLAVPEGDVTLAGVRTNLSVGVRYMAAWLTGSGCVPIDGLMEDAATAEISRTQLWQWIRHGARLDDGRVVDLDLVHGVLAEVLSDLRDRFGDVAFESGAYGRAGRLFEEMLAAPALPDFLTLRAYEFL